MKYIIVLIVLLGFSSIYGNAQTNQNIELPSPEKTGGMPLMEALNNRETIREFSEKEFSIQQISNILWAAFGVNRPDNNKRTAPSAMNSQEMDIYIATKDAIYLYDAINNTLKFIKEGDFRNKMGMQKFVADAPLVLIYVADYAKLSAFMDEDKKSFYTGTSVGYISQNVYLYAASENLATVAIGLIERNKISKTIGLNKKQKVILTQPIGFVVE